MLKISTVRNSLLCPTFLGTVGILRTVETFDLGTVEILSTVGIFEKIIDILLLITLVLGCTLIIDPPVSKLIVVHNGTKELQSHAKMRLLYMRLFGSKLDHKSNEHRNLCHYMRLLPFRLPQKSLIFWHFTVVNLWSLPNFPLLTQLKL